MWKKITIITILIFAILISIPSIIYFNLSNNHKFYIKNNPDEFIEYIPSWVKIISTNHIVPGLDLQGGIRVILDLNYNETISNNLYKRKDQILNKINEFDIFPLSCKIKKDINNLSAIHIIFNSLQERKYIYDQIKISKYYSDFNTSLIKSNSLLLSLKPSIIHNIKKNSIDKVMQIIQTRINNMGINDPIITKKGNGQIDIQLPGYTNPQNAKKNIGRTAQLSFYICDDSYDFWQNINISNKIKNVVDWYKKPDGTFAKDSYILFNQKELSQVQILCEKIIPQDRDVKFMKIKTSNNSKEIILRTYITHKIAHLTGFDLINAKVVFDNYNNPCVAINFNNTGAKILKDITSNFIGHRMAIVLEETINSAPIIQEPIHGGEASISIGGNKTLNEKINDANELATILRSGALPASLIFREEQSIGPTLGSQSIKQGFLSCCIGASLIIIFMILYYKRMGLISIIGLFFNFIIIFSILSLLNIVLTLPGIAGILLTIGISVDANIIINEYILEELSKGKKYIIAIENSYKSALSAILDANITTIIAGLILWQFGSGPVQNFALMLIIGTITSFISAIFITKLLIDLFFKNLFNIKDNN